MWIKKALVRMRSGTLNRRLSPCLLLALTFFSSPPAVRAQDDVINADRPGIADSSTTLRRAAFQIEAGLERDDQRQSGGAEHDLSVPVLFRYGLTDSFELRVEGDGYQRTVISDSSNSGWAPVSAGFKYRISPSWHGASTGLIGRLTVPSGSGQFHQSSATGDLILAVDIDLGERWSLNPNAGVTFEKSDRRFAALLAALTVQFNFSKTLNAFIDGGLQSPEDRGGTSALLLDTGAAWVIGRNTQVDFSIGWGAHGTTAPEVFWSAGLSRRF